MTDVMSDMETHLRTKIQVFESEGEEAPATYRVQLVPEQVETVDGRVMLEGALSFRSERLPLMGLKKNTGAHSDAELVGNLDNLRFETIDGVKWAVANVDWDSSEEAQEFKRLVDEDRLRTVSVDPGEWDAELVVTERDEDGYPLEYRVEFSKYEIGGATIVPFPAMDDAKIEPDSIAAAGGPVAPPAAWFSDPQLDRPTKVKVTKDGRVFGHVAEWQTCHISFPNACLTPVPSAHQYRYFTTGEVECDDGSEVAVGQLTIDGEHPPTRGISAAAAIAHYDNTGTAIADVVLGEDSFGIWFSGAIRPDVTDAQIRKLRASSISGDWRKMRGSLELVAALAVNVPGYPIGLTASAHVSSEGQDALVAAGMVTDELEGVLLETEPDERFDRMISLLEDIRSELRRPRLADQADALVASLTPED